MKTIKHGTEEIKVTDRIYDSYSIRNKNLIIYKGYRTNIYYLTYSDVVIVTGENITNLLENLDKYLNELEINTFEDFENLLREITDKVNTPLYRIITQEGRTISIYKVLGESDSLEMLETSEIQGGKYAIFNKEIYGYKFGLSFEAAQYIFNNQ